MRPILRTLLLLSPVLSASWFQGPTPFAMTRQVGLPIWLAAGDMNGDGVADLVAVHSGTPLRVRGTTSIGIVIVNPDDGARIVSETPFSGDIIDAEIGEFTGDGNLDVLVVDRGAFGPDRLCVASGTGTGTISVTLCTNLTEYSDHLAVGDFNGDGKLDAALTHPLTGQVSIWYGRQDGTFTAGPIASVPNPGVMAAADFNGDGISDLVVHSRAGRLHLLVSAQKTPLQTTQTFLAGFTVSGITVGDMNSDGKPDVLLCDMLAGMYTVGLGNGTVAPLLQPLVTTESTSAPRLAQMTDINADGIPEILVSTTAGMMFARIAADGSVVLPAAPGFSLASSTPFAVLDFTGDKVPDLITYTGALAQNLSVLAGQTSVTSTSLEAVTSTGQRTAFTVKAIAPNSPFPLIPATTGRFTLYRGTQVLQTLPAIPAPPVTGQSAGPRELASARFEVALPAGGNDVSATFTDAKGFINSTSAPVRVSVQPGPSAIRLTSTVNEISREQGLRVSAAVTGQNTPAVDGLVKIAINGAVVAQGTVANGTATLSIPAGLPLGKVRVKLTFESASYLPSSTEDLEFVVRGSLTAANAASYRGPLAADSLAVVAIPGLVHPASFASTTPWPSTLGRITAELRRGGAAPIPAGLVYAGDNQVNLFIPPTAIEGANTLHILLEGLSVASNDVVISRSAPGLFTVNADGLPAALAALYTATGEPVGVPVSTCTGAVCTAAPLPTGADGETLVLSLFGTGFRNASGVTASIGATPLEVLFAGAHPVTQGLDQMNVVIPKFPPGIGLVELIVEAGGVRANPVQIRLE